MNPLVSVIIPSFNRVDYIDQSIRCVLDQTYPNIELIVVDDGSCDGTFDKIKSYGSKLKLLTHQGHMNKGQSASINMGLKYAKGKYIAVLDSDDYWELNKLDIQVSYLEQHPDIGLVYSNGYGVDADGNVLYRCHPSDHREKNEPDMVLMDCYIALPVNSLVRMSVYDEVGGFAEIYRAGQDHDMLIRISEVAKLAYLPEFLWYYRRHGDSISSTQQELRWKTGFKILESAIKRYPYKTSTIRKRKAVLNYRLSVCYFNERKLASSIRCLLKAAILDPIRALRVALGREKRN